MLTSTHKATALRALLYNRNELADALRLARVCLPGSDPSVNRIQTRLRDINDAIEAVTNLSTHDQAAAA